MAHGKQKEKGKRSKVCTHELFQSETSHSLMAVQFYFLLQILVRQKLMHSAVGVIKAAIYSRSHPNYITLIHEKNPKGGHKNILSY